MAAPRDRPPFDEASARALARAEWSIDADVAELDGDVDRNFRIDGPIRALLKISGTGGSDLPLEIRTDAASLAARRQGAPSLPVPIPTPDGRHVIRVAGPDGREYAASLASWLDGVPLADFRPRTDALLADVGRMLAEVDAALVGLDHESLDRVQAWDLRQAERVLDRNIEAVSGARRALLDRMMGRPHASWADLPVQPIHGDANDYNVLVALDGTIPRLGLIDFGDMVRSWRVAEVAIAATYAAMDTADPVASIAAIAAGYDGVCVLDDAELDALIHMVVLRLCVSVTHSARRAAAEPDDAYLVISERPAWALLERLDRVHPRLATARIRAACGRDASLPGTGVSSWLRSRASKPLFPLDTAATGERLHVLDLSVGGADAGIDPSDTAAWSASIERELLGANADIGVGRYLEPRLCYGAVQFAVEGREPEFQRTVHLGVDLFAPAGTAVLAPYDGVVAAVARNDAPLDYGPTVILRHDPTDDRPGFWTLFGHLDPDVLSGLQTGRPVARGEAIARLGGPRDNGGWPPHLHYQVIADRLDREDADFPGVAFPSEAEAWAAICPQPDIGRNVDVLYGEPTATGIAERRRAGIASSLSVSYRRPLHIVRGEGTILYDERGRRYLDCVNNVNHVGHSHPRVVEAARRQMALLNTNTRYLHRHLVDYSERLTALLPDGLDVCFFVNSGSEANDLALRLARAATGRRGVIVVDGAYHGHLSSLIDISPYKFDGPGGKGRPDHVRVVRMPDPFRGEVRGPGAGEAYARDVLDAVDSLRATGFGAGAFIAETLLSCGGQIVPPEGYLQEAVGHARSAGAVYVADEVQTGFGRVGSHWWAFELQGVVPDIVTMGKPIGNGHPLAAVVTTREIADAFDDGMEYFNTYGGNPVSCAVGLAVLDVVRDENLRERARSVGRYLLDALRGLQGGHAAIGDVRGHGLFIGIEIVADPDRRSPDPAAAAYIVERARELGVLLSTDGPDHNVIKIKPPMVFSESDADRLCAVLRTVLSEDYLRRLANAAR